MNLELTQEQFDSLKEIVAEYTDGCYEGIFEYQRYALGVEDSSVKQQYTKMAQEEEARFTQAKVLSEYLNSIEPGDSAEK